MTAISRLTAPERQALLNADPATGQVVVSSFTLRQSLQAKGYAKPKKGALLLTEYGRGVRSRLQEASKPFSVAGVPWSKVEEITDLYLNGRSIDEISRRARVKGQDVLAVLAFRQVLPRT